MSANRYCSILDYCEKMSMSYSYKPVLILALISNDGQVTLDEAAAYFLRYYSLRLEQGQIAERTNSIYSNLKCTYEQIKQNIQSNPVKALTSSSDFFVYNSGTRTLRIEPKIWNLLSDDMITAIQYACTSRLDRYYSSITLAESRNMTTFQEPEDLNGYLCSNYISPFSLSGTKFYSIKQYMVYCKSLLLGNEQLGRRVLSTRDLKKIEELELQYLSTPSLMWNGQMQVMAYKGILAKFAQNETLSNSLLDTGSTTIVACLPNDQLWGTGLDMMDSRITQVDKWHGKNLLGFTLMQVRNALYSTRTF